MDTAKVRKCPLVRRESVGNRVKCIIPKCVSVLGFKCLGFRVSGFGFSGGGFSGGFNCTARSQGLVVVKLTRTTE